MAAALTDGPVAAATGGEDIFLARAIYIKV